MQPPPLSHPPSSVDMALPHLCVDLRKEGEGLHRLICHVYPGFVPTTVLSHLVLISPPPASVLFPPYESPCAHLLHLCCNSQQLSVRSCSCNAVMSPTQCPHPPSPHKSEVPADVLVMKGCCASASLVVVLQTATALNMNMTTPSPSPQNSNTQQHTYL